jgi:hypothetical protein
VLPAHIKLIVPFAARSPSDEIVHAPAPLRQRHPGAPRANADKPPRRAADEIV